MGTSADLPPAGEPRAADLPQTIEGCHALLLDLMRQVAALTQTVALLTERLSLDSRNSSKPPSSDGPASGSRPSRPSSGRPRGAQKGHPGAWRELLPEDQVDAVIECPPPAQCPCGAAVLPQGQARRHQVFDLPPQIQPEVREYRLYRGICCACGQLHPGVLPAGVPSGQIGPRALALVGLLGTRFQMPQHKVRDLLAQVLGIDFSVGAISQAQGKVAAALQPPVQAAVQTLAQAPVLHMDETTYRREGSASPHWVWSVVQPELALYRLLPTRARYVITGLIGEQPQGILITDRYAAYAYVDPERRQVCWSHLLRDFKRMGQRAGLAGLSGRKLLRLGYLLFRWRHRGEPAAAFERLKLRVRRALEQGQAQAACARTANTCAQILKLWPALWSFTQHAGVEPTNNEAERSLRAIVLKRKISGPCRSRRGEEFIANGFSVVESCRRQGRDALGYLYGAITAWIDQTTAPSLLPQRAPAPVG